MMRRNLGPIVKVKLKVMNKRPFKIVKDFDFFIINQLKRN